MAENRKGALSSLAWVWWCLTPFVILHMNVVACTTEGCLRGGRECTVPPPCKKLSFSCDDPFLSAKIIQEGDVLPGGLSAMGAIGDILLENSQVSVVIDAIDHPHFLAPSGGAILDIARRGADNDSMNNIYQGTGLLPWDAAKYTAQRLIEGRDARGRFVALQVRGSLDGRPDVPISTKYELRACDLGVRVRTEAVNQEGDDNIWTLTDAFFWGGKENLPFAPAPGRGYLHPSFGLTTVNTVFKDVAFVAGTAHTAPANALASISCSAEVVSGFHSEFVSAVGTTRRVVPPGDYEVYERFIAVADGTAVAPVADIAFEVRRQLFQEPFAVLEGVVKVQGNPATPIDNEARASLTFYEVQENDEANGRIPWSQAVPMADGRFSVRLPAQRNYMVELQAFGRMVGEKSVRLGDAGTRNDMGEIALPAVGTVNITVNVDAQPDWAQVFFRPADTATEKAVSARLHGRFALCAPLLGAPHGPSPACNRVLVNGSTTVQVPVGKYDVYATAGPFASLARETLNIISAEEQNTTLNIVRLDLLPTGTLSGDFHVHGAASNDSAVPDLTRVEAFLAAGIDVIASTDHDTVWDYAEAMATLDAGRRIALMVGTESTGHILYRWVPNESVPKVNGHWNFWPLKFDATAPYRGAPWDELAEPGLLMTRMEDAGWNPSTGIVQLNHPWDIVEFGRDLGFPRAFGLNATKPLLKNSPQKVQGIFHRTPAGARFKNSDYDLQEVMNGTRMGRFLTYRAFWFYLLNEGVVRAGTANSDSHGLTDNVLGTPRNIVWTDTSVENFDAQNFNAALKKGHIVGTNGPIIEAYIDGKRPSLAPIKPTATATLSIRISAAPWVPVDEVRVVLNGKVVRVFSGAEIIVPADPLSVTTAQSVRLDTSIALNTFLDTIKDAWIVVEAGRALTRNDDLNCDGIPDTGDNNGDGSIDWRDVDRNDDGVVDSADMQDVSAAGPGACDDTVGPLLQPTLATVKERGTANYHFETVVPGGYVSAFTNPFIIDVDGDDRFSGVEQ